MGRGVKDQLPVELKLDRCVHGKVLRHSCVRLREGHSSESSQFHVPAALAELRF